MLPLIRPDIGFDEVADDMRAILDSGILTSGRYVARFEEDLADAVGVRHCVATTSATTALHLALVALGIGPGDEVLVADYTFPATGNVVVQCGATPVPVDCAQGRLTVDVAAAGELITPRTRAILPVDTFGQPAPMPALIQLARDHGLAVVEDAACALGSAVADTNCGAFSDVGCFSFHPRKVVTTGEGGAVTTNDDALADRLRLLRNHGGRKGPPVGLEFVAHGFNYRLSEIPAALGLAQLARLDDILADRATTAARYGDALATLDGVVVPMPCEGERWSYQSYVVLLDDVYDRNRVVQEMRAAGYETTLGTYAMHAHPAFARLGYTPGDLPHSWAAQRRSLTLPLVPHMAEDDVRNVADTLAGCLERATT
jgi:dTDP-4-amino-4,6-dideoxygalactose transaminase